MCKFSRTIYNRQLIQFARIPVEFVVRFIVYQNWVKVITSSMTASYLLLISSYSWCLRDLRVQCLELSVYISFHFNQTRSSLLKFSAQYSERGYVLWNLSTVCGSHHHDPRFIYFFYFQVFFSPILDPRFSILDLTPDFPVNLEVLLIKIVLLFDPTRFGKTRYEISILWTWSAANRVRDSQVQSYPYKHVSDTYVTSDA